MDFYTKAVLTVIALALVALVGQNANRAAVAQATPPMQRVVLCDLETHCTKLAPRDGTRDTSYILPTIALMPGP